MKLPFAEIPFYLLMFNYADPVITCLIVSIRTRSEGLLTYIIRLLPGSNR